VSKQIRFDTSLYLPEAVEAAAAAYAGHAKVEIKLEGDSVVAVLSDLTGGDEDLVSSSFCNHVLHETIGRKRQSILQEV